MVDEGSKKAFVATLAGNDSTATIGVTTSETAYILHLLLQLIITLTAHRVIPDIVRGLQIAIGFWLAGCWTEL